jgi:hypothetical protein
MTTRWTLTFDCHDTAAMARFWTVALGYVEAPPPEGWDSWEAWLRHFEVPEEEWADGSLLEDPQGVLPSIGFVKVPEPKTAKNASISTSRSPAAGTSARTSARSSSRAWSTCSSRPGAR